MTKDELNALAIAFVAGMAEYRRTNPSELTATLDVSIVLGEHPDDTGRWVVACNKLSPNPYPPGSEEWAAFQKDQRG